MSGEGFQGIGQARAEAVARALLDLDSGVQALLIHGPAGAGKRAFVTDLLALTFCSTDAASAPCNACDGCRWARGWGHPDLVLGSPARWREMRGGGESAVSAARRWLAEAAGAPLVAPRRVIVIEEVDRASEDIQNALLKALEEPTSRHRYLLVADDISRVLPTIRSRVASVRIGPIATDTLVALLMEAERLPREQALAVARLSGGLAGRARRFAQQPQFLAWRRQTQAELLDLDRRGWADRMATARELIDGAMRITPREDDVPPADEGDGARIPAAAQRAAAKAVTDAWLDLGRDLLVSAAGHPELAASGEFFDELERAGRRLGVGRLRRGMAVLTRVRDGLEDNASPRLSLEAAMLAWPRLAE